MANFYGSLIGFGSSGGAAAIAERGARGVFGGAGTTIDYITIQSTGDAQDFGDLTVGRTPHEGRASNGSRGVFMGTGPTMDYVTIGSTGNALDFGDLSQNADGYSGASNGVRGLCGAMHGADLDLIEYITIATIGNATTFGDLTVSHDNRACCGGILNDRAVWGSGVDGSGTTQNTMDYVTISTTGNASDFGNLTRSHKACGSCSSAAGRGCFAGGRTGESQTVTIDYITIASTGDAQDFGDLTGARAWCGGCNDDTRGVFGNGYSGINILDYITIGSTGNASDFGDASVFHAGPGALSGD